MRTTRFLRRNLAAAAALMLSLVPARAGEVVITKFNDGSDATLWYWESWSAPGTLTYDTELDAGGGSPNGSLRLVNNFANNPGGYQQCVFSLALPSSTNAESLYSLINMDVKVDPTSTPRAAGDYGAFEIIFRNGSGWTWNSRISVPLNGTGWTHLSAPVGAPADAVHHLTLKLGQNGLLGPVFYNIDNLTWTESTVPPPPPTMSIRSAKPGLNFIGSAAGQYDRQSIYSPTAITSWVGGFDDVTFSMTINDAPSAANPNFQAHMFIVQGGPSSDTIPDWTLPTLIFIQIVNNANGTATAYFRSKVNEPGNNTQFWAPNAPSVTGPSMRGIWTVSFLPNTDVTLTAPDGTTNSFSIPIETAAAFTGGLTAYFGIMPNSPENIGKGISLSHVIVSSAGTPIVEDDFAGPNLDLTKWAVSAADPAGVTLLTADTAGFWVSWTLPDAGFVLQSTPNFFPPNWANLAVSLIGSTSRQAHIPKGTPAAEQGYFQLFKAQ
jgi:hypothetical protein